MKGDVKLKVTLVFLVILAGVGYFAYKYFIPQINSVLPADNTSIEETAKTVPPLTITEPKSGVKVSSPLKIRGTVPPGWMFEGVFPIKLVDANRNLIVQGQATEEVPGSWQSNTPSYFTTTLSFTTSAKSGFIILENDNPSGYPSKAKTYESPVSF
jgi:hypothetical protein